MISWIQQDWLGKDYNLLERNCIVFCSALAKKLQVAELPAWVCRLPNALRKPTKPKAEYSRNSLRLSKNGVMNYSRSAPSGLSSGQVPIDGGMERCSGWLEKRGPTAAWKWTKVW